MHWTGGESVSALVILAVIILVALGSRGIARQRLPWYRSGRFVEAGRGRLEVP